MRKKEERGLYSPFNISLWKWAPQSTMGSGIPSQQKGDVNFQKPFIIHTYETLNPQMVSTNLKQKGKGTNGLYMQIFTCLEEDQSRAPSLARIRNTRSRKEGGGKDLSACTRHPFGDCSSSSGSRWGYKNDNSWDVRLEYCLNKFILGLTSSKTLISWNKPNSHSSNPCVSYACHNLPVPV